MNLINWNEFDNTVPSLHSIFDDFFGRDYFKSLATGISQPAANIQESTDKYTISVAIPGVPREDCHVDIENGMLTVSAQTSNKQSHNENEGFSRYEYNFSSFSRSFVIPEDVDIDAIEAKQEDGELCISLPKNAEVVHNKKTIDIK